jgi:hypothetical protein
MLGGFLRQMNDTIRQNREMVQKKRKKLFDKKSAKPLTVLPTEDPVELNGDYLKQLRKKALREKRKNDQLQILALVVLVLITWMLIYA